MVLYNIYHLGSLAVRKSAVKLLNYWIDTYKDIPTKYGSGDQQGIVCTCT